MYHIGRSYIFDVFKEIKIYLDFKQYFCVYIYVWYICMDGSLYLCMYENYSISSTNTCSKAVKHPYFSACTAWKVSKYGVIFGPYFAVFGLNTGKYGPEINPYLDTFHNVMVYQDITPVILYWPNVIN